MLGGQVALLTYQAGLYLSTGAIPGQLGNAHPMIAPYDTFATADGYVNIAVGNNSLWERFCTALDLESLLEEDCFASNAGRSTNREALYASLERIDKRMLEAGYDLYGRRRDVFFRVTLPLSMPGVVAGVLLTFIPAAGDFINAELLGTLALAGGQGILGESSARLRSSSKPVTLPAVDSAGGP
jgi:hypothetical protein